MTSTRRLIPAVALIGAAAFALAGCSSSAAEPAETNSITLAFPGAVGPTDTPALAALQAMSEDGWETDYIEFDSPDVATQALIGGDVNIASMGPSTVMAANAAGADLRIVANNNVIDQLIVAAPDVQTCADLDGRTVAYHSEGSTSTAHLMRYLEDNCPEASPEFLVISGSGNRAAALLEGQIDGTIVRLEDWVAATATDDGGTTVLATLAEEQSTLLSQTLVVNKAEDEATRTATAAFLAALDEQLALVNEDPAAFAATAAELLGSTADELAPVFQTLSDNGIFPESSKLDEQSINDTIAFYEAAGVIDAGTEAVTVADFTIAEAAGQ
ncbi:ABC-type nitrate/sulfonate/bicarbonate transport system, substrate-binding protein [Agrococcus baldri]|uniref:ABC-type nitrate/sulfonate/bicarbonate transport system, substrate-binding protein n=1 Tax=Agrococcus baldri TaxID=153730 RepID=A0AA94HML1_9MICO|nr:ABC transporter substrate-binding protein [Agrococcus baldri]SFS11181.1 ABC-type nitrate/sulfonate/bicarbonate transport system, substrate-binding protein [Agrococcus baldri]